MTFLLALVADLDASRSCSACPENTPIHGLGPGKSMEAYSVTNG